MCQGQVRGNHVGLIEELSATAKPAGPAYGRRHPGTQITAGHSGHPANGDCGQHRPNEAPRPKQQTFAGAQQPEGLRLGPTAAFAHLVPTRSTCPADRRPARHDLLGLQAPEQIEGGRTPTANAPPIGFLLPG